MATWQPLAVQPWNTPGGITPTQVSVGSKRIIWGLNTEYAFIYKWNDRGDKWDVMPGKLASYVSAAGDGTVWCVSGGALYSYSAVDKSWAAVTPALGGVTQLSVGSARHIWAITTGTPHSIVHQYRETDTRWTSRGTNMIWVSVAADGTVWCVNTSHNIEEYCYEDDDWLQIPGPKDNATFSQVAVLNQDYAWGLSTTGETYFWSKSSSSWTKGPQGDLANISAGSDGTTWGVNPYGQSCAFRRCPDVTLSKLTLSVDSESVANYATLEDNPGYGMTGLMTVKEINVEGNTIAPGTIFLFPGVSVKRGTTVTPYAGTVNLNGQPHAALINYSDVPDYPTLHLQMCRLLNAEAEDFIGFSVRYPWDAKGSVSFNSGTCNIHWFGIRRVSDANCGEINWRVQIISALAQWLAD